jgi:predicted HTH domain antitoxin
MKLEIPEDILRTAGMTEKDCLAEFAVHLYANRRISFAQAIRLCGLKRAEFEQELARRDVALYTVDDLHEDVETLKGMGRL